MSSFLNMLLGSMTSDSSVSSLSKKTGVSSKAISALVMAALPLLMKSMTQNASSASGISSLMGALSQHKSTKSLEDQISEADVNDGQKIIGHIFGDNTSGMINQLSSQTGISSDQVSSVLGSMAPALLSTLSATTTAGKDDTPETAADMGGLADLVGGILGGGSQSSSSGLGGLLGGLGSLFGGSQPAQSAAEDGTDLLSSLLNFKF